MSEPTILTLLLRKLPVRIEVTMKTTTYEAIVENGQIKLPPTVHLPEHTRVLVVVPDVEAIPASRICSPRLAHPEQASSFTKEVLKES